MRDLNFKVYVKDRNEIFDVREINLETGKVAISNGYIRIWRKFDEVELLEFTGEYDATKWDSLPQKQQQEWLKLGKSVQEWTGLKIYEGQILDVYGEGRGVVVRMNSCFAVQFKSDVTPRPLIFGNRDEYKVVGYIYENPELLNEGRYYQ